MGFETYRASSGRGLLKGLLVTLLAILPLAGIAGAAYAQSGNGGTAEAARSFSVPAGPLGEALNTFAGQAGISVQASGALVRGKQSRGLQGDYTVTDGLRVLLAGSDLATVKTDKGVYVLRQAQGNELAPVSVTAEVTTLSGATPAYPGGQVSTANRVGQLGTMDIMEAPFNVTGYTSDLIEDQQARSVADVLVNNDASVRLMGGRGDLNDDFTIRGFPVNSQDVALNGVYGLLPYWRVPIEFAERVELLRGPSAALSGMPPSGGVGGTINVVPKRAADEPLTRVTLDYTSDSQVGTHLDLGRRFGVDNRFGVRFNGVYREGDTALEDQSREFPLFSLGLDFRGERLKLAADILHQKEKLDGVVRPVLLMPGTAIPEPPDTDKRFGMKNSYSDQEMLSITTQAEYAVNDRLDVFATLGGRQSDWDTEAANINMANSETGDMFNSSARQRADRRTYSGQAGLRGRFETGAIRHEVTFSVNRMDHTEGLVYLFFPNVPGNLYAPPIHIDNDTSSLEGHIPTTTEQILSGMGVTDRLFMLDDKLQLTLGARRQWIDVRNYDQSNGQQTAHYDDQAWTPVAGLAVMPTTSLTFYANAVQGLSMGDSAPVTANNPNETLSPYKTQQYELGMKYDSGDFGLSWAAFQIEKPNAFVDATNTFREDGEQRNRGLELNVFGEPLDGVRVLTGLSYIRAEQTQTQNGVNDGNDARGVPERQANIGVGWSLPMLPGASVDARWVYTGSAYFDAANTLKVPSWDRYDLGAKYRFKAGATPVVIRANVENLLDDGYWQTASYYDGLTIGAPRTVTLSVTADF